MAIKNCWQNLCGQFKAAAKKFAKGESGLALIMVMSLIVVVLSVVGEIIFQSEIASRSAVGERDRVRAEISALTGAQFAMMLVLLDSAMGALPPEVKAMVSAQMGDVRLGTLLDGIPLGAEVFDPDNPIGAQTKDLFGAFDEPLVEALKSIPGYFVLTTTDESGKLNVNLLAQQQYKETMKEQLTKLFSGERETRFLDSKHLTPSRLVANLVDYVDRNTSDELSSGDEAGSEYTQRKFTHKPKNAPFESIEELRRVPGFEDDEIYGIFTPYLTVWPITAEEKSFNINVAPVELLAALSGQGQELNEKNFDKIEDDRYDNQTITEERSVSEFIDKNLGTNAAGLKRIATINSNVFKIEVRGVSNGVERTYVMVLDRSKNKTLTNAPPVRVVYQRFL